MRITLLGASWEPLGGQDEAKMEPSWAKLGPSWPQVGVKLALGGNLEATWLNMAKMIKIS